jgi:hypothetical protein
MVFSLNPGRLGDDFVSNAKVTPAPTTFTAVGYCNGTSSRGSAETGTPRFSSLGAFNTSSILLSSEAGYTMLRSMNLLLFLILAPIFMA